MTYEQQMNSKPLIVVKEGYKLLKGQFIGYVAFGDKITAAYPIYNQVNSTEYNFILSKENNKLVIDNDWIREDRSITYTNQDPIIVEIEDIKPSTFSDELIAFFNIN